mmetsp:Transcript_1901/g.2538  ORF Transcript_1901/g.2538 Transcript_1901/m.2538 type:complete len:557 (-) Transcript_1901:192-1862(-)|eukprot:CAMPEP_0194046116 /NCGR_PEP_ID=MMETSP0009_2-20130614/19576_1 /TAXON_ID=210454 /ORGANISM="Grammatophora oceanica, Strain CCMP 410" /LENGTH=556 /DNA_ID=CAMNT_0038691269 /DNA_START=22 /DNA_END=1695 /DNA_ORIENTATION=+
MNSKKQSSIIVVVLLALSCIQIALAQGPPPHVIDKLKERLSIKKDKKLKAQKANNKIRLDGNLYSLKPKDLVPFEPPISRSTIFVINGEVRSRPPLSNLFTSKDDPSVIVALGRNGKLNRASKGSGGTKKMAVPVEDGSDFFVEFSEGDLDFDEINAKYTLGDALTPELSGGEDNLRSRSLRQADNGRANRGLQSGCSEVDELEVAIAFDSSFCDDYNSEEEAIDRVYEIVATASSFYEKDNVCMKVTISTIDGFCGHTSADPYKAMVDSNTGIGCSGSGLLQDFKDYWTANRPLANYPRDTAHLFYGKDVDGSSSNTIGCAYTGVMCNFWYGYGVNQMSHQNSATSLQEQLFAHELGHNAGAPHASCPPNSIMCGFINSATMFSTSSANSMKSHVGPASCISTVPVGPVSTPAPVGPISTPPPTSSPVEAPAPGPSAPVDVTFYIKFDYYPEDYGFEITAADDENNVYYSEPTGGWSSQPSFGSVTLTFELPGSQDFTLHFYDSWGDGLGVWSNGWYGLYFGTTVDSSKALVLDESFYGSISYRATDFTTVDPSA